MRWKRWVEVKFSFNVLNINSVKLLFLGSMGMTSFAWPMRSFTGKLFFDKKLSGVDNTIRFFLLLLGDLP